MYYDRKENKNVDTFGFVQLYIIGQHCLCIFSIPSPSPHKKLFETLRNKEMENKKQIWIASSERGSRSFFSKSSITAGLYHHAQIFSFGTAHPCVLSTNCMVSLKFLENFKAAIPFIVSDRVRWVRIQVWACQSKGRLGAPTPSWRMSSPRAAGPSANPRANMQGS